MKPYECYVDYLALKRHFTTDSYDYFKYNGKVSAKRDAFEKRKDKFFFEKLSKHRDPHGVILANLLKSKDVWIKELVSDKAQENYNLWIKKTQSITRLVESELWLLDDNFDSNFKVVSGNHPPLLKLFLSDKLSLESLIILTTISGCIPHWCKNMKDDFIWDDVNKYIIKTKPFIHYDVEKIKKICLDRFSIS
jgi:hypothetical protein